MKKLCRRISLILIAVCMLLSLILSACSTQSREEVAEDLREKLELAFQYLENMEYDSALDAFAQIINIDEKQVDAYIGMARAFSSKGQQKEAGDYAGKGYEATGNQTLGRMSEMYEKITESEDLLKETAALLEAGASDVPEEIGNVKTGLISETLDRIWETLDGQPFCDLFEGYDQAIIYPVDAEHNYYLILYPSGYFFLGEVEFMKYKDFLTMLERRIGEEEDAEKAEEILLTEPRDLYAVPKKEGAGTWAGINEEEGAAVFYTGGWSSGRPNDEEGFCAVQMLPAGSRFVVKGPVQNGQFIDYELTMYFASQYEVMQEAFKEGVETYHVTDPDTGETRTESFERIYAQETFNNKYVNKVWPYNVYPFELEDAEEYLMQAVSRTPGLYSRDFENRRYFEMIDAGDTFRAMMEAAFLLRDRYITTIPVEGNLLQINGFPYDYNADHGLYILGWGAKSAVIDNTGRIRYAEYEADSLQSSLQFNAQGFSGLVIMEPGSEDICRDTSIETRGLNWDADLDVWQVDYDWEGNETGRRYYGKRIDLHSYYRGEAEPKDVEVRAEITDEGILVTDLEGGELGRILVDFEAISQAQWQADVIGRMIRVRYTVGEGKSQNGSTYLFLVPES